MEYNQFKNIVRESVESGLSVLGEGSKQAIIIHFMKRYNITSFDDIAEHASEFEIFLNELFQHGSNFLIMLMIKRMFEHINMDLSLPAVSLATAVQEVKRMVMFPQE